jgi:hypothetical protein
MIQCILDWFKNNSDAVTGLTSFGALVIAIVGFGLTIHELRQAQIALKAGNMYTIQKDARELIQRMMENPSFFDFIRNHDPKKKYTQKTKDEANRCLGVIFNFYLAVFRQYETKGISTAFAQSMGSDFLKFFSIGPVQAYYNRQREAKAYDDEHQRMVELWNSSKLDHTRS